MAVAMMTKEQRKNTPVRIDEEALGAARIASGYTGESMAEYISRIVKERADQDVQALHAERFGGSVAKPKGKRTAE